MPTPQPTVTPPVPTTPPTSNGAGVLTPQPQPTGFAFGIDPSSVQDPNGQQFLKAFNYYAQNPGNPLSAKFYANVQSGVYDSQAQSAGVNLLNHPDVFPSFAQSQEGQDESARNTITSESNSFTPQGGDIPGADKIIQGTGEAANETLQALTSRWSPLGWISDAIGGGTKAAANIIKAGIDPVATAIGGALRSAVGSDKADAMGQKLVSMLNSPEGQKIIQDYTPAVKDVGAVGQVANLGAQTVFAGQAAEGAGDIPKIGASPTPEILPEGGGGGGSPTQPTPAQQQMLQDEHDAWAKPTETAKATYNKPTDVYNNAASKGTDVADVLVKNGIRITDNVDNGNYATADTAEKMRADAGQMSSQLLRPSLQMADYTTPKTPVSDIVASTIEDIKNSKGVTPADMETQIDKVKTQGEALERKYPDGMGLTDMHDEKINYNQNGKFSPVGDTNVNNNAGVNRAFGRTLAGAVEDNAPDGVPVKEFNQELAKQYQAADYLDSLDGKKVPQDIWSRIRSMGGKALGATVGNALGGGILGDVAGYHLGGMLESFLENLPADIRGHYLNNLEMTNPPAFDAVKNYMGQEQMTMLQRRLLPAAGQSTLSNVSEPVKGANQLSGVPYEGDRKAP